jgi:putative transposase
LLGPHTVCGKVAAWHTAATTKYENHRFPAEVISHAVWLSFRFCLSFRDVEERLLERGMTVT